MKYLRPMNFYKEIFKDILMKNPSKHGRLLGLDVGDKYDKCDNYVSLAVSDWKNLTAVPLRGLHMQEHKMSSMADIFLNRSSMADILHNMSSMADILQSLISEHNLVGFVFGSKFSGVTGQIETAQTNAPTQIFIDTLRHMGKLEGLKYTFWDGGVTSQNADFVLKQHVKFILENLNQPQDMSKRIMENRIMEKCHAISALQGYLDCTNKMVAEDWDDTKIALA